MVTQVNSNETHKNCLTQFSDFFKKVFWWNKLAPDNNVWLLVNKIYLIITVHMYLPLLTVFSYDIIGLSRT